MALPEMIDDFILSIEGGYLYQQRVELNFMINIVSSGNPIILLQEVQAMGQILYTNNTMSVSQLGNQALGNLHYVHHQSFIQPHSKQCHTCRKRHVQNLHDSQLQIYVIYQLYLELLRKVVIVFPRPHSQLPTGVNEYP